MAWDRLSTLSMVGLGVPDEPTGPGTDWTGSADSEGWPMAFPAPVHRILGSYGAKQQTACARQVFHQRPGSLVTIESEPFQPRRVEVLLDAGLVVFGFAYGWRDLPEHGLQSLRSLAPGGGQRDVAVDGAVIEPHRLSKVTS